DVATSAQARMHVSRTVSLFIVCSQPPSVFSFVLTASIMPRVNGQAMLGRTYRRALPKGVAWPSGCQLRHSGAAPASDHCPIRALSAAPEKAFRVAAVLVWRNPSPAIPD
ncbi:MAG TPA: hypothetical protein VM537_12935, partial [Anaerolineae bacterium]|nr:hypothetical protein [Anaerolineae bacterium]